MKRAALVVVMIGSLSVAGQASAHGHGGGGGDGGAIVGALIGGAVLGALVGSVANSAPVYAQPVYAQPVYAQPVYAAPAYAQPVYAQPAPPPPGYCFDNYRRAYVACGPAPQAGLRAGLVIALASAEVWTRHADCDLVDTGVATAWLPRPIRHTLWRLQ